MAETEQRQVRTPDGKVMTVKAPVGATDEQLMGFAKQQYEAANPPVAAPAKNYQDMDPVELGLTAIGNIPKSGVQFVKDITAPIHSPVETAEGVYALGKGLMQLAIPGEQGGEDVARQVGQYFVDRYGSIDAVIKTAVEDPVGVASDVASLFSGGASLVGKVGGKAGAIADKAAAVANAVDPATLAARGVGRALKPRTNPALETLMAAGVKPTIGQTIGGAVGSLEEKLTSVPIVGDVISSGRARAAGDLTRAAFNRVLEPLGETAADLQPNRQGLAKVSDKLNNAYDNILDNVSFTIDDAFVDNVSKVVDETSTILTKEEIGRLNDIVSSKVFGRLAGDADAIAGRNLKATQSELRKLASKFSRGGPGDSEIGEALSKIHDEVTQGLIRHNPDQAAALKAVDSGYANYVRLRKAFSMAGKKSDGLTPASLDAAVRATDQSVGKGDVARGRALMQDLSSAGVEVLGPKVPDSGTAGRAAAVGIPTLLAGGGAIEPTTAILSLLAAAPYIPTTQGLIADLITKRTPAAKRVGAQIQKYGPTASRAAYQSGRLGDRLEPYLLKTGR